MFKKIISTLKKLTLFDISVLGILLFIVVFFALVFFRKSAFITVTVKVGENDVAVERWSRPWYSSIFYKGMKEKDGLGRINAELIEVKTYDVAPAYDLYIAGNNRLSIKKAVYLTLKIKAVYGRSSNQYTYKGLPVLVGTPIKMYLDRIFVEGIVTNINGVKNERERKTLIIEAQIKEENSTYLETSGTDEFISNALSKGQKVFDDQGNLIIEILDKKVENAKRVTVTDSGRAIVTRDPLKKDVYLTLKVFAFKENDKFYLFDDVVILINNRIPINTPIISVLPVVTNIKVLD